MWRWTQRLRALGVRVKGHPRTGYRIERVPDVLSPSLLRRRLRGTPFGKRIYHYFKTASTNSIALELGHAGEPHGTLIVAEEQSGGRGRSGRTWHSEKTSGIYMSVLLRPAISPIVAPVITMVAGLAVRDAVVEETGIAADLRWPNDLLAGGKKFCGILTEMHAEPSQVRFVIVGIGINVNHAAMPADLARIGHIAAHGHGQDGIAAAAGGAVAAPPGDLLQSISIRGRTADSGAICRGVDVSRAASACASRREPKHTWGRRMASSPTACCACAATTAEELGGDLRRRFRGELMLLAVDVGNTNTVLGVFRGAELIANWRLTTARDQTVDEYGILTRNLFTLANLDPHEIRGVIISSVVPPLNSTLAGMAEQYFHTKALFVEPGIRTGMPVHYDNPQEVGADRIVNSIAAFAKYGGPCIVVDFGTAINFDVVSEHGEYLGGALAPGIGISAEALFSRAARLWRVEIRDPGKSSAPIRRSRCRRGFSTASRTWWTGFWSA